MKRKLKGLMGFLLSLALVMGLMLPVQVRADVPIANLILTLYANDGSGDFHNCELSSYNNYSYTLTENEFSREKYKLIGWSESADGDIEYNNKNNTFNTNTTLYAVWQKDGDCTITFYANEGTGTVNSAKVKGGETYLPTQNVFTYPYHYLAGWAESADGQLKYRHGDGITINDDTVLYAVWGQSFINNIPVEMDSRYIYYGGGSWRVIGADDNSLLLISDSILDGKKTWQAAKDYCGTLYASNVFSAIERAAISSVTKNNDSNYWVYKEANLENAYLFLLSASEAETYFSGNEARKPAIWWLRSPNTDGHDEVNRAGVVEGSGIMGSNDVNYVSSYGARPAFVLNLESVLFTSAAEGGKSSAAAGSGFGNFSDGGTEAKKLTLLDNSRSGFAANIGGSSSAAVASGGTVAINYSGAGTGTGEYVSAMLCNSAGDIIGYASVASDSDGADTWSLTLPSDLTEGATYTLKVFSEQQNGDKTTDYASTMIPITLTVRDVQLTKEDTPNATFTAMSADSGTLSDITAGMKYSIDGGSSWTSITGTSVTIASGVTTTNGIKVYKPGNGTTTSDSDVQTITVSKASKPSGPSKTDCTTAANNDGTISGVTASMEYKKSGASAWKAGTGNVISDLSNGTYYIRTKASDSTLASDNLELTIAAYNETTPTGQVATPTFSPAGGSYTEAQSVTISCPTVGADIYYTTNGNTPTSAGTKYTGPISVSSTTTIKAIAVKSDMTNSDIATAAYTINSGNGGNGGGSGGGNGGSGGNGGNGGGNSGGGGGVDPAPGPSPVPDPDPAPDPTPDPAPDPDPVGPTPSPVNPEQIPAVPENPAASLSVTDDPGAGKTAKEPPVTETNKNEDGSTTEKTFVENNDGSTTVTEKTTSKDNSTTISRTVVTESDKTVRTRETVENKDGSKVETVRTQKEGYLIEKTVETTSDGKTREKSHSVITDEATKAVTETKTTIENDGSTTESSRTTQTNKDFKEVYVEKDKNQNLIEAKEISRVSDPATGRATETEKIISGDGTSKELKIVKGSDNKPLFFSESQTGPDGEKTDSEYSGKKDGTLKLDSMSMVSAPVAVSLKAADDELLGADSASLIIPGTITGIEQETFIVSEIGNGAFKGLKLSSVTLPDTLTKVDEDAFSDCGITELNISGKVNKGMFGKNALSGCGTGKKGKGLTINVQSKKYQKQMKKQLKKAGAGKAKVVIQK